MAVGEIINGKILNVRKNEILVDLGPMGVGFVPRREVGFGIYKIEVRIRSLN
jgi:DNA-directed RNA polymerase subunit E'/Rpb7